MQTQDEITTSQRQLDQATIEANVGDGAQEARRAGSNVVNFEARRSKIEAMIGEVEDYHVGFSGETDVIHWNHKLIMEIKIGAFTFEHRKQYMAALREAREASRRLVALRDLRSDVEAKLREEDPEGLLYCLDVPEIITAENAKDGEEVDEGNVLRYKELSQDIKKLENAPDEVDLSIKMLMVPNLVWWNAKKIHPEDVKRIEEGELEASQARWIPVTFDPVDIRASLSIEEVNGASKAIFDRLTGEMSGKVRTSQRRKTKKRGQKR